MAARVFLFCFVLFFELASAPVERSDVVAREPDPHTTTTDAACHCKVF